MMGVLLVDVLLVMSLVFTSCSSGFHETSFLSGFGVSALVKLILSFSKMALSFVLISFLVFFSLCLGPVIELSVIRGIGVFVFF